MQPKKLHPQTLAIRTQTAKTNEMEHSTPLFLTSSFTFDSAEDMRAAFAEENDDNIYSRYSNPSVDEFVAKVVAMEGADAGFATASGMAAVFNSIFALVKSGDHIIFCSSVFGSTHALATKFLPKYGIECTLVPSNNTDLWEASVRHTTKMIFVETPTNPQLEILDLEWVGKFAEKHQLIFNVDNCFATPVLQNPIAFGAHIVNHSATKWMDGQGRVLGGVVVGKAELIREIYLFCRNTGPSLSPFNAWVISKSLETLAVRMEKHAENALAVASQLEGHPKIKWVRYPFLPSHPQYDIAIKQMRKGGGVLCFELAGGRESGIKFLDSLELLSLTPNLGDTRSIASHPTSTTHSKLKEEERLEVGITPGLIRISVGLEYVDDILADILQALDKC